MLGQTARATWTVALVPMLALTACSASEPGGRNGRGGGSGGASGQGGSAAAGGSAAQAGGGGSFGNADGGGGRMTGMPPDELTPGNACAEVAIPARPLPLDMYIMLDSTGSMGKDANVGTTCNFGSGQDKWCYTVNALDRFFQLPTSVGMGVALSFFNTSKALFPLCDGVVYTTPRVPMGLLPDNVVPLRDALNAEFPIATTDTEPALIGIVNFTAMAKQPDRTMVGILVTDGKPNQCNEEAPFLAGMVRDHLAATGITTFVIGMEGAHYDTLEVIAEGGGAPLHSEHCSAGPFAPGGDCHYYDVGNGDPDAFVAALETIQQVAVGCRFVIPAPTEAGKELDFGKVNIDYTRGDASVEPLFQVAGPSACVAWGWHYNDPAAPTEIHLCPESCDLVDDDDLGRLDVILGCKTRGPE